MRQALALKPREPIGPRLIDVDAERAGPFPLRPTEQRIARANEYDDGRPTHEEPYIRKARLCTPWDKYCAQPKDKKQKPILEAYQITAGNHYAGDYDKAGYGKIPSGQFEPTVDGAYQGEPGAVWDARGALSKAQKLLRHSEVELLDWVLFKGESAAAWAKHAKKHHRVGMDCLKTALDVLAEHYGYSDRRRR